MYTTIKISTHLKGMLDGLKVADGETYEELIASLVEDHLSVNEKTRKELAASFAQYKRGGIVSFEEVRKKAGLNV